MKRKVSLLLAMVLTVLSVMMVMPVEAKAADYPTIMLAGTREWGLYPDGNFASQNQGSCTINLDDRDVIAVNNVSNSYVTVHFSDGSPSSTIQIALGGYEKVYSNSHPFFSSLGTGTVTVYWKAFGADLYFSAEPYDLPSQEEGNGYSHVHNFVWGTIVEPTKDCDGLEGEVCSCGAMKNTQPILAMAYSLNTYANSLINAAKPGQTITFEFGEMNSFPKSFMEKLVEKNGQNVTFVFHYKWNHVKQEITIPAGTPINLNFDWYGPAKMAELYGAY